jgi:hypothetical protein
MIINDTSLHQIAINRYLDYITSLFVLWISSASIHLSPSIVVALDLSMDRLNQVVALA